LQPAAGGTASTLTGTASTITSGSVSGGSTDFPGFYARGEGEEDESGGNGHLPDSSDHWGNEDDYEREEEVKLMDKLRKHQRAETGVYLAHNQFDQYEEGSVVRSPDSNILKKVEELFWR